MFVGICSRLHPFHANTWSCLINGVIVFVNALVEFISVCMEMVTRRHVHKSARLLSTLIHCMFISFPMEHGYMTCCVIMTFAHWKGYMLIVSDTYMSWWLFINFVIFWHLKLRLIPLMMMTHIITTTEVTTLAVLFHPYARLATLWHISKSIWMGAMCFHYQTY